MKEIKFKFYCEESCNMSRVYTLEELANGKYDFHCDINKAIKLQYTTKKDKTGTEIYDGDILKGVNGSINGVAWEWGEYQVKFKEGKHNVPDWGTSENFDSTHWFEIVGSKYKI